MKTAKEAREQANSVNNERNQNQLKDIEASIETAINNNKYEIWIDEIFPEVKSYLEDFGYKIKITNDYRNESSINISW